MQVIDIGRRDLLAVFKQQGQRLKLSWNDVEMTKLKEEMVKFQAHIKRERECLERPLSLQEMQS